MRFKALLISVGLNVLKYPLLIFTLVNSWANTHYAFTTYVERRSDFCFHFFICNIKSKILYASSVDIAVSARWLLGPIWIALAQNVSISSSTSTQFCLSYFCQHSRCFSPTTIQNLLLLLTSFFTCILSPFSWEGFIFWEPIWLRCRCAIPLPYSRSMSVIWFYICKTLGCLSWLSLLFTTTN